MKFLPNTHTLSNGLRYLVVPMPGVQSATVLAMVKAGTRYETPENNGISHFVEHMVFKGTQNYPTALDIATNIDNVGGSFNAFTNKEYTGYYVKAAVSHIGLAMDMVSQLVFHPLIPAPELEVERGVILEEIRMYEDEPASKVGQLFEEVMFTNSTLAWDTLGTFDTIRNMKRDAFVEYMNYLYAPNRVIVVVAGGVEETPATHQKMEEYFGVVKAKTNLTENPFTFSQNEPKIKVVGKKTEQCHLIYGFPTFGRGNKDRYVLSLMATILGGGMSSRLFTEIREKRGLAYYVSSTLDIYDEGGYVGLRAGTNPATAQEVIDLGQKEFEKMKDELVDKQEMVKAKEFIKGHLLLSLENSYEVADFFAEDLLLEDKLRSVDEVIEGIEKVSAQDIKRVANTVFVDTKKNLAAIGPKEVVNKLRI